MPGIKRVTTVLLIVLILLAVPGCRLFGPREPAPGAETEEEEITFTATEMFTGETLNFPGDFPDQAVYLVFFADG